MKQITQAIFEGAPNWVKSAAVDADGSAYLNNVSVSQLTKFQGRHYHSGNIFTDDGELLEVQVKFLGYDFDATDWQNSAIDRKGYRCPKCDYHHSPHQCRECECINCYSLII